MVSDLAVAHSHDINSFEVNFSTRWRHTEKHSPVRSMIRFIGRHQLPVRGLPMDICVKIGECGTKSVIWVTHAIFVSLGVRLRCMVDEVVSKEFLEYLEVPTALHFFRIAADHGFCGIAWRHRVPFGFRLTLIYLPLFLENTQLTKAAHPILCAPGSNNFPVFELVDVHNLNVDAAVL